jgi:hypothetical protein
MAQEFRAQADKVKRRRSDPDGRHPFWDVLRFLRTYVMQSPNGFLERLRYFGFATDDTMMIIIRKRLTEVLGVTGQYLSSQLSAMGWEPIQITPATLVAERGRFHGQLFRIDREVRDIEIGRFGRRYTYIAEEVPRDDPEIETAPGDPQPEPGPDPPDIDPPFNSNFDALADPPEMEDPPADAWFNDSPDDGNPDELVEQIEAAVDQVLEIVPEAASAPESPRVARPTRRPLTPGEKLTAVRAKVMRLCKQIKGLKREISERERLIRDQGREILELKKQWQFPPSSREVPSEQMEVGHHVLAELNHLICVSPKQRRFSGELTQFAYSLHMISPRAYRYIREVLPLPSPRSVSNWLEPLKATIAAALDEKTGPANLPAFLEQYRSQHEIPDRPFHCTLAFDATSVTATGLPGKANDSGSCFAFIMLPLDHRCPNLLIRSIRRPCGQIRADINDAKDQLVAILNRCGFPCVFLGTDGDRGMNEAHQKMFQRYEATSVSLASIVEYFFDKGDQLWPLPASDLLHLMKNARSRIAMGKLAFYGRESTIITGASITKGLEAAESHKEFQARKPLDLLKDDLAIRAFTIERTYSPFGTLRTSQGPFTFFLMSA